MNGRLITTRRTPMFSIPTCTLLWANAEISIEPTWPILGIPFSPALLRLHPRSKQKANHWSLISKDSTIKSESGVPQPTPCGQFGELYRLEKTLKGEIVNQSSIILLTDWEGWRASAGSGGHLSPKFRFSRSDSGCNIFLVGKSMLRVVFDFLSCSTCFYMLPTVC